MVTPYDWQEGIGHRAQFVEARLATGSPVIAMSIPAGVVAYTTRRTARKLFEVYDHLLMGAMGQQSDVELVRMAAIDFCHQEGYNRSSNDVTIQRVAAALSRPIKQAFNDFNTAPFVVRALMGEVAKEVDNDRFYVLDYDGDFIVKKGWAYVCGTEEQSQILHDKLTEVDRAALDPDSACQTLAQLWRAAIDPTGERDPAGLMENLTEEVALLERASRRQRCFRLIRGAED